MSNIRYLCTTLAASSLLISLPAFAADLPNKVTAPLAPLPLSITNWEGFYIGAHTGSAFGASRWSHPNGAAAYFNAPYYAPFDGRDGVAGLFVGATLGYNHQIGPYVFGVEGDIALANLDGNARCGQSIYSDPTRCHTDTDRLGSLTARLGYSLGRALLYVKVGGAYAHDHSFIGYPASAFYSDHTSQHRFGWALGLGAEYALTHNLSAKMEYDYYAFGSKTISTPFSSSHPAGARNGRDQHLVKFGLNYHFDQANLSASNAPVLSPDVSGEFGGRIGWGTGRFSKNLIDMGDHSTLSRLTYSGAQAVSLESFARFNHTSGLFLKGTFGGANIYQGNLQDEDFPPGITPYSSTSSAQRAGRATYAWADVGYSFLQRPTWAAGAFVGAQIYSERYNAFGCHQTATNSSICGTHPIPDTSLGISQSQRWIAPRLGVNAEWRPWERVKLYGEAAFLPFAQYSAADNHWYRGDITTPIRDTGHGHGFQLEGIASYDMTDRLSLGLGMRYTAFRESGGTKVGSIGGTWRDDQSAHMHRTSIFLQAAYAFGGK